MILSFLELRYGRVNLGWTPKKDTGIHLLVAIICGSHLASIALAKGGLIPTVVPNVLSVVVICVVPILCVIMIRRIIMLNTWWKRSTLVKLMCYHPELVLEAARSFFPGKVHRCYGVANKKEVQTYIDRQYAVWLLENYDKK